MKKLAGFFSMILILASCTQVKIAHVDIGEVMKEYEGSKKAEEKIKAQSEKISNEIDQLAIPFQQKVQEYQKNQGSMSADERQKVESELMQEQQMLQQRQQMAQQQVQMEGQQMIEKINEEIDTFLESYAKSNGYTYILGSSDQTKSVLYGEESMNVTDAVIDALNENYEEVEPVENTEEVISEPVN